MTSLFTERFEKKAVFGVIHTDTVGQTLANAAVARNAGFDGVFLVNHTAHVSGEELFVTYVPEIEHTFSDLFVGVNCLDMATDNVLTSAPVNLDGVWCDYSGVDEGGRDDQLDVIDNARGAYPGLYFGSVAFKYQKPVKDVQTVARRAVDHMDVVVTSGAGTGLAPDVEKLAKMKEAVGDWPLAVASGVTPDNVTAIGRHVDAILVATGVSKDFFNLDETLCRDLVAKVRAL